MQRMEITFKSVFAVEGIEIDSKWAKYGVGGLGQAWRRSGWGPVAGICAHGNEPLGSL